MNPLFEKLKKNGLRVGDNTYLDWNCIIDQNHCWLITIGNGVTVAPGATILAHDASTKRELGATRIAETVIEDGAFIGAGAIILPGVTIGKNSIIGAGAVVTKNVPSGKIFAGNPAKEIGNQKNYITNQRALLNNSKVVPYNKDGKISKAKIFQYKKLYLRNGRGFQE